MKLAPAPVEFFKCRDGIELAYSLYQKGTGSSACLTPLVMINGLSSVKEDWGSLPRIFARERDVVVFDNRCIGDSYTLSKEKSRHRWQDFSESVIDLMDHLKWKNAVLLGHSMGGMIAQKTAVDSIAEKRIKGLILLGTAWRPASMELYPPEINLFKELQKKKAPEDAIRDMMAWNVTRDFQENNSADFERLMELKGRRPEKGIMQQIGAMLENRGAEINLLKIPTLVLHGDLDAIINVKCGEELAEKIPNSKFVTMQKFGHSPHFMLGVGFLAREIQAFFHGQIDAKSKL